jgi:sugar/nucleoside kinase (ribokinase family)
LLSKNCEIAVVKIGSEGSWIKRGDEIVKVGTLEVQSKDTTGAGDLYAAGFLYGYSNDMDIEKSGLAGSVLAGHVIEIMGARMDEKKWDAIKKQLVAHQILS